MDEEAKNLIKENNQILKKLLSYQKWSRWFGAIKWLIIVGSAIGAIYYFEPIIDSLWQTYTEVLSTISATSVKTLPISGQ